MSATGQHYLRTSTDDSLKRGRTVTLVRPFINVERNSPFFLPLGLLSIAGAIRAAGHNVRILDFEFQHRTTRGFGADEPLSTFIREMLKEPSSVVGFTVLADTLPTVLALARRLKQASPETVVVIGGPGVHGSISAIAEQFSNCVDYICLGEGETSLLGLLESDDLLPKDLPGMRRTGQATNSITATPSNIDSHPFPAYDLVDVSAYLAIASPRIFDLHVGSGCTYKCSFCTTAPFWDHRFRARSPKSIFEEMCYLFSRYGIDTFNLVHDNFTNDKSYVSEFVAYFKQKNDRFKWGCAVRPDNAPLELMKEMRAAGCRFLFCGTDAGDPAILRDMRKMTSSAKSYRFFRDAREADILFETNTIIGYPNEDETALEAALEIVFDAIGYGGYTADASVLQPLPGAPITIRYRNCIEPTFGTFGTYLPEEARQLIAQHPDIFTGFGFIRHENRPYSYYCRVVELIRFFTRHYFRSIYFAKKKLGIPYRRMLDAVSQESSPMRYGERLRSFVESTEGPIEEKSVFRSVFLFEDGLENVKGIDASAEITNVYSRPERTGSNSNIVVDVGHEVHRLFDELPTIGCLPGTEVSYLFKRQDEKIVTVRLKPWQRYLWTLSTSERGKDWTVGEFAVQLSQLTGATISTAHDAIEDTLRVFDLEHLDRRATS